MKNNYDYLVVGAGLYGAVFAEQMTNAGKKVLVVDKRNHVAGNIYTEKVEEIQVHKHGAHIFHTNNENVWEYVKQFAKFNDYLNCPIANFNGEIYNLPFNMNTFCKMWNISTPNEAKAIIAKQIKESGISEITNLEEQAISLVGRDIYEKLIKGYTEKQWGRECKDLPSFIIKRLPVRFTFDNNYFDSKFQGIPIGGYTKMIEKMLENVDVELNVDFNLNKEKYSQMAEYTLYTGALDEFYNYEQGQLQYRGLRFETEKLDVENYQGNAVVNYTSSQIPYTRIIEHKFFEKTNTNSTIITKEFSSEWRKGEEPYYPINDKKNDDLYSKYAQLAQKERRTIFGGRLAEYKYYDMDKTIEMSMTKSHDIIRKENF